MKLLKSSSKFAVLFLFCYYSLYFFLFRISFQNKLLIENIQEKVVLEKDVIGKSLAEFDRTQNYDLIFLGSSHCYRCFDPFVFQKFGLTTYNLGSSSQTPIN